MSATTPRIDPARAGQAAAAQAAGAPDFVLLDVRAPALFRERHVPGAVSLPRGKMSARRMDEWPQGTLFGRNTSAGALSIFTALPQFDKLGGYIEGSYGNYNAYEIKGAVTGPISEKIALRFDGGYRKREGGL